MNKALVFCVILLSACSLLTQPRTVTNPACEKVKSFVVFQVFDDFVLAKACKYHRRGLCVYDNLAYIEKEKGSVYYDEQKIFFSKDVCPVYYDSYTYQTINEDFKTVPKVKYENRFIPATSSAKK